MGVVDSCLSKDDDACSTEKVFELARGILDDDDVVLRVTQATRLDCENPKVKQEKKSVLTGLSLHEGCGELEHRNGPRDHT